VVRVRYHRGDVARVEVPVEDLPRLVTNPLRDSLMRELLAAGFKFVSLDLAGFRSGSLNALVPASIFDPAPMLVALSLPASSAGAASAGAASAGDRPRDGALRG
jgi:hypothetical protein